MARRIVVAFAALLAFAVVGGVEDADACSCVGPQDRLVGPDRTEDAALNTRVRFEVASLDRARTSVLRVSGGANTDTTMRSWPNGFVFSVELTPTRPLQPGTRYEIAVVEPNAYPSTTVLGTFKTGTTNDTTAPKLEAMGAATARANAQAGGGNCSIPGPWIEIPGIRGSDPGRPEAKLLYAVWAGDAAGNVDTSKPPATLIAAWKDMVTIGKRSLCDPHDFPIPSTPFVTLAIAAVDESGNTSAPRKVRVDLRSVRGGGATP